MEKLGIANEDLLKELRDEYGRLRREFNEQVKLGSGQDLRRMIDEELSRVKSKIDELEKKDAGTSS